MAAGQRKFEIREVRFRKDGANITADVEYRWGVEETSGSVEWRSNTVSFSKEELQALLSVEERQAMASVFTTLRAAVKTKGAELATAQD